MVITQQVLRCSGACANRQDRCICVVVNSEAKEEITEILLSVPVAPGRQRQAVSLHALFTRLPFHVHLDRVQCAGEVPMATTRCTVEHRSPRGELKTFISLVTLVDDA
jgi:hypothetical protein